MTASPNGTVVTTSGQSITDAFGDVWTITTGQQIAVNNIVDTSTRNVVELAYVNGTVWQLNTAGNWYSKTRASDAWSGPTTTSPIVATQTPVPTPTPTASPSYVFSLDFSPQFDGLINAVPPNTPSPTPTATPSPTPSPTASPTPTPTSTPSPTPTPTPSPTATATPTPTPTPAPITHAALQARLDQVIALLAGISDDLAQLSP